MTQDSAPEHQQDAVLSEYVSSVCPSRLAPQDVSKDFRALYPITAGGNRYASKRGHHEVYYGNAIMHWRCGNCGEMWHRRPHGPFVRHETIIDGRQVYQ